MIIRSVKFVDFGIFGGEHEFDLFPLPAHHFNRPLIIFNGKNGVGKTTLVEGIRLCLHGSLALGSRVAQREFEDYLDSRIHRPFSANGNLPTSALVEVCFEHVSVGKRNQYRVCRKWQRSGKRIEHFLDVWENEEEQTRLAFEQCETLLRELIPVGLADLFFFDGEKIETLSQDESSHRFLAETVKALLGLNLVEQLEKDLDVFITRTRTDNGVVDVQAELATLRAQQATLEEERATVLTQVQRIESRMEELRQAISTQEQEIAEAGGWFAQQRDERLRHRTRLEAEMEAIQRQAHELCNGLMPFAIAPQMLHQVLERLQHEQEYEESKTAKQVLGAQLEMLQEEMAKPEFWMGTRVKPSGSTSKHLYEQVAISLRRAVPEFEIDPEQVIHHVSEKERGQLASWVELSLREIPHQFCTLVSKLETLSAEMARVDADLNSTPDDQVLQPLTQTLLDLSQDLGAKQHELDSLVEQVRRVDFALEQNGYALKRIHQQLADQQSTTNRLGTAAQTQLVLEQYKRKLTLRKVALLEEALARQFNVLCRKQSFIDRASVDPETFEIKLFRRGQVFEREQLSAGERQLLSIATLWALREVSGRPTPVIVDTPLSRLDSEHRLSMIHDFLPQVSHQVIVLATDAEIDNAVMNQLAPAISHVYQLEYNAATGSSEHVQQTLDINLPHIQLLDSPVEPSAS